MPTNNHFLGDIVVLAPCQATGTFLLSATGVPLTVVPLRHVLRGGGQRLELQPGGRPGAVTSLGSPMRFALRPPDQAVQGTGAPQ